MFNKLEDSSVSAIRASKREPSKEPTQKDRPEAVSFCTGGIAPVLGRVIALAALVRASGLRLQYRFLIRRFGVWPNHFPFAFSPRCEMSYEPPNIPLGSRCRFGGISPSPSPSLSMAARSAWTVSEDVSRVR